MRLIIGGAYQGKTEYAKNQYPNEPILGHLEAKIREDVCKNFQKEEGTVIEERWKKKLDEAIRQTPNLIILCDEVGMGIVPMEAWERLYREVTGHLCIYLADKAETVERVSCGISQCIAQRKPEKQTGVKV